MGEAEEVGVWAARVTGTRAFSRTRRLPWAAGERRQLEAADVDKDRILRELQAIAFAKPILAMFDPDGKILPPQQWPEEVHAAIRSFEVKSGSAGDGNQDSVWKVSFWNKGRGARAARQARRRGPGRHGDQQARGDRPRARPGPGAVLPDGDPQADDDHRAAGPATRSEYAVNERRSLADLHTLHLTPFFGRRRLAHVRKLGSPTGVAAPSPSCSDSGGRSTPSAALATPWPAPPTPQGSGRARRGTTDSNLHAGVSVLADQRDRLGRIARYALRPPVAQDRLEWTDDGQVRLELRRSWSDGTTHLLFDPVELLERLAALTPRPRIHLILYRRSPRIE